MARIVIREQDLTGNRVDQDFTDIAFVPGFVKYPKEDYTTPQLCYNEQQFIDMFGNEPAVAHSRFIYTVNFGNDKEEGGDNSPVLNPETGNELFYLDANEVESVSDSAYHYARELLYRGLPIYYCPMNKREAADDKKTNAFVCDCDEKSANKVGQMIPYDGNQDVDTYENAKLDPEDEQYASGRLVILHKGSDEPVDVVRQGAAEKFKIDAENPTEGKITIIKKMVPVRDENDHLVEVDGEVQYEEKAFGVQSQKLAYDNVATFTVQVEGTNVERILYKWYLEKVGEWDGTWNANEESDESNSGEEQESKKMLISTSQTCNISCLTYADPDKDMEYRISVEITGIRTNAKALDKIYIVEEGEPLTMKKILAIAKAKAIDEAIAVTYNTFGKRMIDFFKDTNNTELIKDRGLYNFKYLTTGGYPIFDAAELPNDGTAVEFNDWELALTNLLEVVGQKTVDDSKDYINEDGSTERQGRGDCVLLIDHTLDKCQDTMDLYSRAREWFENPANVSADALEFAAMFTPWCNYSMTYTSHNVDVNLPASFAYLSCLADSIQAYDNWHAISGVTRGTVKNINEVLLMNPLTNTKANKCQADPETAEKGRISINCITEIKPYGQVIWGNRTLQRADAYKHVTAMGFLNLRNEVSDIKKLVYRAARRWMFEQNTSVLWVNFKSTITPLLDRMVNGYGLSRYEIRKGAKTAKHKLYAEIRIWPIYAVEYIDVTIQILDEETIVTEE